MGIDFPLNMLSKIAGLYYDRINKFKEVYEMIDISKINLELGAVIDPKLSLILLHAKPQYRYENGKATEEQIGMQYEVITNGGDFDRFWVKVPDMDNIITEDEISASKEKVIVTFSNAVCKLYTDQHGHVQVSVKAQAIHAK